jgi:hypothetical protein
MQEGFNIHKSINIISIDIEKTFEKIQQLSMKDLNKLGIAAYLSTL